MIGFPPKMIYALAAATAVASAIFFLGTSPGIPGAVANEKLPECLFQFEKFEKTVSYRAGGNRLLVSAAHACGWKHGRIYDLQNVRLTLGSRGRDVVDIRADKGAFVFRQNQLLISNATASGPASCLRKVDHIIVDLHTGEVRTPGLRLFLNGNKAITCSQFRGKGST